MNSRAQIESVLMMRFECLPLDQHATNSMKSNKCKDTKPELLVRKALREAGYPGYRLQWKVPGRPDIAYPGRHIAIFVNGCFWHRCPFCNLPLPKSHTDFWKEKFDRNVERDRIKTHELESMGWIVITVWECELKMDLEAVVSRITNVLESRRQWKSASCPSSR